MNPFMQAAKAAILRNGILADYKSVSAGVYDIATKSTTNTSTVVQLRMYKKHIRATQYNYPDLIGKDAAEFYIVNDSLSFVPKPQDRITYSGNEYTVSSYRGHIARGEIVLYKIIAVKA